MSNEPLPLEPGPEMDQRITDRIAELQAKKRLLKWERWELDELTRPYNPPRVLSHCDGPPL